ncbi:hypothetical protein RclHR1_13740007 [Rhizophagus clarus]|uniref:Jacalin-type lectin domain-containing protein n=1 Tax=Rhizophagus clarus TaxID=94130 RepID=A0A2Z6QFE4_9GLOM|nr:hypothetical protein RclHR1_13740007 [Rhizophagus clarus]
MPITLKPSQRFGGNGGASHDDLGLIINDPSSSGIGIKKILIIKIEAQCGNIVDSVQFTYRIETTDGFYELLGNKYGGGGGELSDKLIHTFTDDEQMTRISGRTTPYIGTVISNLEFYTSKNNIISCGNYTTNFDTSFTLPVGVFYGNGGDFVDNVGTYEISDSQSTAIALSCTTGIFGFCLLIIMGIFLWKKFRKQKAIPVPPLANN